LWAHLVLCLCILPSIFVIRLMRSFCSLYFPIHN
jgi:hypothetical protein